MTTVTRRLISRTPPALLVGFVVLFSAVLYWTGDAVMYQFIYDDATREFTWEPIRTAGDIWRSMTDHYLSQNGRFICHVIVSAVTSFMPHWLFAISNGLILASLLWMVCRLSGVKVGSIRGVWSVTFMGWLAFDNLTDPAFYINYIWMGTIVVAWLMMFLRHPAVRGPRLVLVALFSLIAGQAHECFALPVGLALIVYLIEMKGKLSRFDWVAGICFCVAGLTTFISPGTFHRVDHVIENKLFVPSRYDVFLSVILPLLFFYIIVRYRKRLKEVFSGRGSANRFWLRVLIGNLILAVVTLDGYGTRAFTIGSVAIIILVIRITPRHGLGWVLMGFFICMAVWLTWVRWRYTFGLTSKYEYVEMVFFAERPDTIWMPDKIYQVESRFCDLLEEDILRPYVKASGDSSRGTIHPFKVLPESLRDVPRDFEENLCRKVGRNLYLLVQSKENPAKFVVHKNLFPGVLNLKVIPDRELHFVADKDQFDIYVDSTDTWIAAFYSQEYIPYADFEITME